jgi:putative ABC transport system ATP-binding protein
MLKLENVCYRYKNSNVDVLKYLDVEFEEGKLNAILGPSGSGKTTLLSIMAGLDRPTEGSITLDGDDLAHMDLNQYRRERISMVFQAFHLFPSLSAIENVCYPMETDGADKEAIKEMAADLLESVGITSDKHNRYPSNLSGGEQQRVAIARALSTGAKVILADEPTGNLDTANGEVVISILRNLAHTQGYCVIVVTHNLEIAEVSDVVYRMTGGVIKQAEL